MQGRFYWTPIPGVEPDEPMPGKLIVLEGTDGVGRSTQTRLLRNWLEGSGLAVYDTGLIRGRLAGRHIQEAKEGHTMGRRTQSLYYATDFADRLENEILPALRAGYVVLTDRYIYSLMARAAVRGMERDWLRKLYGFALRPDLVLYLQISIEKLIPRVLASGGYDYWESGMDYISAENMHDAFVKHQTALLQEFDHMAKEYDFAVIDATRAIEEVFHSLQTEVKSVVEDMSPSEVPFAEFMRDVMPLERDEPEPGSVLETLRDFFSSMIEDA
ncbi:MAG: dTMP kinase [Armatimonadetes bacterium]|nr:dTMP kinase [Armatimonadota bacterium]